MEKIKKPNEINNIISLKKNDNIVLASKENRNNVLESYYFTDFMNSKRIKRFIKSVESRIRKSDEYKHYLYYLNEEQQLTHCSILGNIKNCDATLEFHHYPFTLYDICEIVINKHILEKTNFNSFTIVKEVLDLHFDNVIGLVKLSKTIHELVHNGNLFIKLESVFGDVNEFINTFYNYIPLETIEKYNEIVKMNSLEGIDESIIEVKTLSNNSIQALPTIDTNIEEHSNSDEKETSELIGISISNNPFDDTSDTDIIF